MPDAAPDPLEFLKSMWGQLGFPLPGMVAPTVDLDELDKRVADLKAVEGWLKMNLGMLQMTIQGLEMQRSTLAAWQALGRNEATEAPTNPFAPAGFWPWNQPAAAAAAEPAAKKPRAGRRKQPAA